MKAILIIQILLSNGLHVHHVKEIEDGKYSYNTCMWQKVALERVWAKRDDVVYAKFTCPNWWAET